MELPHILYHRKSQVKHVPQAHGDIYWDREDVLSSKFTARKRTTKKISAILINSNRSYLPMTTPFSNAILHTSLYRTAPFLCFALKSPCLHFCSLVAPASIWGYGVFSDRKQKQVGARLIEEEGHATFYLP